MSITVHPFTPEQEARVREIVRGEIAAFEIAPVVRATASAALIGSVAAEGGAYQITSAAVGGSRP